MRTRTTTPRRKAFASIAVVAGLAIGASACGSDDETPDDVDVDLDTDTDTPTDTMTETIPLDMTTVPVGTDG